MVLQTPFIAKHKGRDWMLMMDHIILYAGPIIFTLVFFERYQLWKAIFILVGHLLPDLWKSRQPKDEAHWYCLYIDQGIHLFQLIMVWWL
ncbi:hypothetical protein LCGC14_2588190, partial [marine sediment metagenome]